MTQATQPIAAEFFRQWFSFLALFTVACVPLKASVVFVELPDVPVFQGDLFPTNYSLDLNGDGNPDVVFSAYDRYFNVIPQPNVQIFGLAEIPPDIGGYVAELGYGDVIGDDSIETPFSWQSGTQTLYTCAIFGGEMVCLGFWGNGEAHLGFRIEEEDGFRYGYTFLDTPFLGIHGGYIKAFAYETEIGQPIIAGAIPEASTVAMLGIGMVGAGWWLRQRHRHV